ncbi:hypothetical protein CERSUDRAFT_126584 [Gelatoporia subvermispora B]|uniref:beta-glucosidase n=1 Tax=Ceriporiopsis subvermispora (strain B) TaxID=914234 RepID=M2Q7G3_CERS8|nr:hypothetical protein CERSUDRAFT_126584 [Gelatoporia subvermispora B]
MGWGSGTANYPYLIAPVEAIQDRAVQDRTDVLCANIAGQEAGNSIVDVLYGDFNPSGRLPYPIAKSPSDYPAQPDGGGGLNDIISVLYIEGLFIDYRHFDALEQAWAKGEATPNVEGASTAAWLHRPAFEVMFEVKNTGPVAGSEIPQLYLHSPDSSQPPSLLRGFADVLLSPDESQTVHITLSRYDLSVWDVDA